MSGPEKQIISVVSEELRNRYADWSEVPQQGVFSRARIIDRAEKIYTVLSDVTASQDYLGAGQALEDTRSFVTNAFDIYDGKKASERYPWVFAVPGRIEDAQNGEYASEVTPFLPILSPDYGVDDITRQHTTVSLAPSVIETYNGRTSGAEKGAIVWTPFYVDSITRLDATKWRQFVVENTPGIRRSVSETAQFAAKRLGAQVMGLGASIPSFTQMGKSIKQEGLTTTTGHAGTVYLLNETVNEVIEKQGLSQNKLGLLGAGSIGSAWAELTMSQGMCHRLSMYDRDDKQIVRLIRLIDQDYAIDVQDNELEVLRSSDVIVSAINRTLDLDYLEWYHDTKVDLTGKIIIDDSQPGAFERDQVEARGGSLVWVVGQDMSMTKTLHRENGYNFGDNAGLFGEGAVWGCEAEAGAVFLQDHKELAINSYVTPEMVVAIGALCREIGIEVAHPLQSFGKPVDLGPGFALRASGL